MRKIIILTCFLNLTNIVLGQFNNTSNFYLAFLAGRGSMHGTESLLTGPSPTNNYATFDSKNTSYAMTSVFSSHGTKKINLGFYLGATIGGGNTNANYDIKNTTYDQPHKEFHLLGDLRIGLQVTHVSNKKEYFIGARYFNWYNADGLRTYYGNADDAAAIGFFGAYKKFGVDLNIAPKNFPGILVKNKFNFSQLEIRYKSLTFDNDNFALFFGSRMEFSSYEGETNNQGFLGYEKTNSRFFSFLIGFGTNNK